MDGVPNSADELMLRGHADALAAGIEAALPEWVQRCVARIMVAWVGELPEAAAREAAVAGRAAAAEIGPAVRTLLTTDVDQQATGPLALAREAVRFPTDVLAVAGVPPVVRDAFAERTFPADVYDLAPASFGDLDPALQEAGIAWGASKAHVMLSRRRAEGHR